MADALALIENEIGVPQPDAQPPAQMAAPAQAGNQNVGLPVPDQVQQPTSQGMAQSIGLTDYINLAKNIAPTIGQGIQNVIPGLNNYRDILRSVLFRGGGAGLGASLGTAINPGIGTVLGTGAGIIGGNLLDSYAKSTEGNPQTPLEVGGNIALDTAFSGAPAAIGAVRGLKPVFQLSKSTIQNIQPFKRLNIPVHPLQLAGRFADKFRKGPVDEALLETFKATQDQAIEQASEKAVTKLGAKPLDQETFVNLADKVSENINTSLKAIGSKFDEALGMFGNARIGGKVLVQDLQGLKATLLKKDPVAANIVGKAINNVETILAQSRNKTLSGEQIKEVRTFLRNNLKEEFTSPNTGQLSPSYSLVSKTVDASLNKLENTLAQSVAKTKPSAINAPLKLGEARAANAQKEKSIEKLAKTGGSDLERAFRETGRNPDAFGKALKDNPDLLLNTFLKSKNPTATLAEIEKYAGKQGTQLVRSQFASKVLNTSNDVISNSTNIKAATKDILKYKSHSNILFGEKATNSFIRNAQDLTRVKAITRGTPEQFATSTNKTLNPDYARDNPEEIISNIGRGTLGGNIGRVIGAGVGGYSGYKQGGPAGGVAGAAAGTLFGNQILRGILNFINPNAIKPLGITSVPQLMQYTKGQNVFDLLKGGLLGGFGGGAVGQGAQQLL